MVTKLALISSVAMMASVVVARQPEPAKSQPAESKPADQEPADTKPSEPAKAGPKRAASGKSIEVPDEQKKLGTVYHTLAGANKQVTFTSEAHGSKTDGHSAGVIGYVVTGSAENPADLKAGAWMLPVKSLETGNPTKNKNISKPEWLDAAKCPDIMFTLKSVKDIAPYKAGGSGKSFKCTFVGEMTMRGVTKEITIPDVTLGFVQGTERTAKVAKGDLLAIRCKYTVKLTDYGVTNDMVVKDKAVGDDVVIDQSLSLATVPPEEQPEKSADKPGEKPAEKPVDKPAPDGGAK